MNDFPNTHLHPLDKANALDSRFRSLLQNPRKILKKHIKPGMTVLDLGCGTGYFTLEMAKLLNKKGKVIAADVQNGMLEILKQKLEINDLQQEVQLHSGQENTLDLTEEVDFVLAFYSFHEMKYIDNIINDLLKITNHKTQILISEQKFHVPKNTFTTIIKKLENKGFKICERPRICLSRTVLMTR